VGIGISALLLWLMISQSKMQWQQLQLSSQGWVYFFIASVIFLLTLLLHAQRVKQMWFLPQPTLAFRSLVIGNFYNCLLPGNLGEGMRAWHFSRKNKVPLSRSFANIILEKVLDAQIYFFIVLTCFVLFGFKPHSINYAIAAVGVGAGIYTITWMMWLRHTRHTKLLLILAMPLKNIRKKVYRFYLYFRSQHNDILQRGKLFNYVSIGFGMFLLNALQYLIIMKAVGLPAALITFGNGYYVALCMVIIMFIPSAPGNTGVMHYGLYVVMIYLAQYQLPDAQSPLLLQQYALFAVFVHLSCVLPEMISGAIFLWLERRYIF